MNLKYVVLKSDCNFSVFQILKNKLNISTRLYKKLISNNLIKINETIYDKKTFNSYLYSLKENDMIYIDLNYSEDCSNTVPTKMDLDIIFEDDWLLILNKPAGIPVHPSRSYFSTSLSNGVRYYFDTINLKKKIRIINRLDLNTSGLLIFAKCEYIHNCLSKQMIDGTFKKKYLALATGIFEKKSGIIDLPIARKER